MEPDTFWQNIDGVDDAHAEFLNATTNHEAAQAGLDEALLRAKEARDIRNSARDKRNRVIDGAISMLKSLKKEG